MSQLGRFMAIVCCLVALPDVIRAGVMRGDVPPEQYVAFGNRNEFQSVGWFSGYDPGSGEWVAYGSAVGVGDPNTRGFRHVLLSGHEIHRNFTAYKFSLGPSIFEPPLEEHVTTKVDVLGYGGVVFFDWDLAVLTFDEGNAFTSVFPAAIDFGPAPAVGTHILLAGYGRQIQFSLDDIPDIAPFGIKTGGENLIDEIGNTDIGAPDRFGYGFDDIYALPFERGGAPGDSGSGVFWEVDGQLRLGGITVEGAIPISSSAVRLGYHADWLRSVMRPVPEPSSLSLLLAASVGFLIAQKKAGRLGRR